MKKEKNYKNLTTDQALEKLRKYCAYQDRCHSEVRTKLLEIEVYGDELEEIISLLIQENFLNEERFAQSYVRGKFRIKKWGRIKIMQGLKLKRVSAYCIKKGMQEIEEDEYYNTLKYLISKKWLLLDKEKDHYKRIKKLQNYIQGKGYEYEITREVMADLKISKK